MEKNKSKAVSSKILIITFLILLLMIPKLMIDSIIEERQSYSNEAKTEVVKTWGDVQNIVPPLLVIPYQVNKKSSDAKEYYSYTKLFYLLPEKIDVNSNVSPEIRKRGIFEVLLYESQIKLKAKFDLTHIKESDEQKVLWEQIYLNIGFSDLKGLKKINSATWIKEKVNLQPGVKSTHFLNEGVHGKISLKKDIKKADFFISFSMNGSKSLSFSNTAKESSINMQSEWTSPSFYGSASPQEHAINKEGFNANWQLIYLNQSIPQFFFKSDINLDKTRESILESAVGVNFLQPVNNYQKSIRASKYAILFVFLTFLSFFLFEIFLKIRLHIIQYALVGVSLSIFYLLLISISEQINFDFSYFISALMTIIAISLYALSFLKSKSNAIFLFIGLSIIYSFFYILLQAEDFALLMGSIALFIIIGLVMYMTRKIDWFKLDLPSLN